MSIPSPRPITAQVRHLRPDTLREFELINARRERGLTPEEAQELDDITERQVARAEANEAPTP